MYQRGYCRNIDLPIKRMLSISCCSNNPTSSSTSFSQRPLLLNLKSCRSIREVGLRRSIRASRVSATTIHGIICHAALTDTRMSSHLASSHLPPTPGLLRYHIQYHSDYVPMLPQPQLVREVYYVAPSQPVLLLTLNMELNRCIARVSSHSSLSVVCVSRM